MLDNRHALEIVLLEKVKRLVERHVRADRVVRRLGDPAELGRARIEPGRDDRSHERLAGDHPDQATVVADEERPHLGAPQSLPRLLSARAAVEHRGIRDHRVAHAVAHG